MNILGRVAYAYASESQLGSCFTAPLRSYRKWFAKPIQDCKEYCAQVGWKVAHAVSAIFAYLLLAIPTAVGILINLFAPLPTNLALILLEDDPSFTASSTGGYSLWAISAGLPQVTQHFLENINSKLETLHTHPMSSMRTNSIGFCFKGYTDELLRINRQYTYEEGAILAYVLYEPSLENSTLPAAISSNGELQLVRFNDSQCPQERLDLMPGVSQSLVIVPENEFPTFDEQCEQFSQWLHLCSARLNWIPNSYTIRSHNGYTLVVIRLPNQLIPRAQKAYPNGHLRLNGAPPPLMLQSARVTT